MTAPVYLTPSRPSRAVADPERRPGVAMTSPVIAYAVKVRSVASGGWYWLSSAGDMGCHHGYRMLVSSREHALREASLRGYSRDNTRLVRVRERAASEVVSLSHHMASVAMTRLAALDEAERVARDPIVPLTGIADAIAAIRGSK